MVRKFFFLYGSAHIRGGGGCHTCYHAVIRGLNLQTVFSVFFLITSFLSFPFENEYGF